MRVALIWVTIGSAWGQCDSIPAPNEFNIPEKMRASLTAAEFQKKYKAAAFMNPFYLRGDFDGDGRADYVFLVIAKPSCKKGIAVWLSSRPGMQVVGAGQPFRLAAGAEDDFSFFDSWQVAEGPRALKREAIRMEKSESAGGIIYWIGTRFAWRQEGD